MKCEIKWVGLFSAVLLVSGQLNAQNASEKRVWDPDKGWVVATASTDSSATVSADATHDAVVSEVVTLERLRKNALREYGETSLANGRKALRDGNYDEAVKQYSLADAYTPDTPDTVRIHEDAQDGIRQALYLNAQATWKRGDREAAIKLAKQAAEKGNTDATALIASIQKEIDNPPKAEVPKDTPRLLEASYKEDRDEVMHHFRLARQYYIVGEYDKSRTELEIILRDHPYNTEAIEMLKKLNDRTYDIADEEFLTSRSRMIRDVKASWSPRRYAVDVVDVKEPTATQATGRSLTSSGVTREQEIEAKMKKIVLPEITFRNANINDVITFFTTNSREYDDPALPAENRGVNFVLRNNATATPTAPATDAKADPFAAPAAGTSDAAAAANGTPSITFAARFITLWDALKTATEISSYKFRIRGNIVFVIPSNISEENMETRSYIVVPDLIAKATSVASALNSASTAGGAGTLGGGGAAAAAPASSDPASDLKKLFGDLEWPTGSSIIYISSIGKLRVVNTVDNLAKFEKMLEEMKEKYKV